MKFLSTIAALAATASAAPFKYHHHPMYPNNTASRVIMTNAGTIYLADFDGRKFTPTLKAPVSGLPSWVHYVEPGLLYAVDEDSSTTRVFNLDLAANTLELRAEAQGSSGVVYLEPNHANTRMLGAGYGQGTVDVWDIADGGLKLLKTIVSNGALGPNTARQDQAHPHQAVLDPTGRFFAVNDLGTDQILLIDGQKDAFEVVNKVPVTPAGCGPRHGAFYPPRAAVATHYMVVCELLNVVNVWSLDYAFDTINFTPVQTISTLGHHVVMPGSNSTAAAGELVIAGPRDVYVSNRLTGEATDNIAHFAVSGGHNGTALTLQYAGKTSSGGTNPRMFSVSDNGRDVLVGNQGGAMGVVALRRSFDGVLAPTPITTIEAGVFGADGSGPEYIKQIA